MVVDRRRKAKANPAAQLSGDNEIETLLSAPYIASPLRRHDCCPITDGVSVLIITEKSALPKGTKKPVYIRGIDHRMEAHQLGIRIMSESGSTTQALAQAKFQAGIEQFDIAELYASFSPQILILKDALNLDDQVDINPSGGPLAGHIMMSAGLDRFGMSFRALQEGEVTTALAHATSGPCLQHNMIAILEAG